MLSKLPKQKSKQSYKVWIFSSGGHQTFNQEGNTLISNTLNTLDLQILKGSINSLTMTNLEASRKRCNPKLWPPSSETLFFCKPNTLTSSSEVPTSELKRIRALPFRFRPRPEIEPEFLFLFSEEMEKLRPNYSSGSASCTQAWLAAADFNSERLIWRNDWEFNYYNFVDLNELIIEMII